MIVNLFLMKVEYKFIYLKWFSAIFRLNRYECVHQLAVLKLTTDFTAEMLVDRTIMKTGSLTLLWIKTWATFCYSFDRQHGRLITWLQSKNTSSTLNANKPFMKDSTIFFSRYIIKERIIGYSPRRCALLE